ncbi:MAG: hypothetical protein WCZ72_11855 [Gemmobacter sp.]
MNKCVRVLLAALLPAAIATGASAAACDYRPSHLIGGGGTGAAIATGGAVAGAGTAVKAAGFYTLTHAATGATMLGSTAGGASAAGTVGIMGGTAGVVGTAAAIITAPVTIIGAAAVAVGTAGFEGVCYYLDERVTDYGEVLAVLRNLHSHADNEYFQLVEFPGASRDAIVRIKIGEGQYDTYRVRDLYIANGVLKNSDWGPDIVIGNIGFIEAVAAPSEGEQD